MGDRKVNPLIILKRKELELSEKRIFSQRQQLRLIELDDEKAALIEAIKLTNDQILLLEADVKVLH